MSFISINEAEDIFKQSLHKFPFDEQTRILEALDLSRQSHSGQFRDEGSPYIIHPIRVAILLINELGVDDGPTVIAALLHDSVEDTSQTIQKIKKVFGQRVAEMVRTLTRDKDKETKKEKFEKIMKEDFSIRAIKVCDWLDNMCSWRYISPKSSAYKKFPRWFSEAEMMYIPLAQTVSQKIVDKMEIALQEAKKV